MTEASSAHSRLQGRWRVALALGALMILAVLIRSLGFEFVFVGDHVTFPPADAQYHLRRALYTFAQFPAVLLFDPYINFPGGAPVPWPPLFDFLLGGAARLLANDHAGFERVVAWAGPACAALTLIPVYLAARLLDSRRAGLVAALCYACLPVSVTYSRVGNPDHHSAVSLVGAWLLLACLGLLRGGAGNGSVHRWGFLLGAAQIVLLYTWHGSLLYLGLANALLLAGALFASAPRSLFTQSVAALVSAAALVPLILVSPQPLGGWFSAIALSWLHVLAMASVAGVAAQAAWITVRTPGRGPGWRLAVAALGTLTLAAIATLVPAIREGVELALQFLTQTDQVGKVTGEQNPLFGRLRAGMAAHPLLSWGGFAYVLPLVPGIAIGWAALGTGPRDTAVSRWFLAGWAIFWVVLALGQRRYGNDLAPGFAVLFAMAAFALTEWLMKAFAEGRVRRGMEGLVVLSLLGLFLWPVVDAVYGPRAQSSIAAVEAVGSPPLRVTRAVAPSLARFMREVRRATPETSAYLSPGPVPTYGVIAHANLGHALQYGARRATATDPFWWYIGRDNWQASFGFLAASTEGEALAFADRLHGRYLVTTAEEDPLSVAGQLHRLDGLARKSRPALTRFRLVSESLPGGRGLGQIFRPAKNGAVAYKLFEIVPGAKVVVEALPGQAVQASLQVRSNQGRLFRYRAVGLADDEGKARLVLPYATEPSALPLRPPRTEAMGAYRLEVAGQARALHVPEQAVVGGEQLRVRFD